MKITITGGVLACSLLLAWRFSAAQSAPSKAGTQEVPGLEETTRVISSLDGPTLYKAYCAVCHGSAAKGDGPMAKMLTARTPDLTRIAERHGGKFPRPQVDAIISGEAALPAGHGTREMPVWGPLFSQIAWDTDLGRVRVDNVSRYLESLQK
jgi:mono/diheme cytochrome c family protein